MLDENLPTFYLRSSNDGVRHNASVLLSQHGSEAVPAYFLRHPDPALPASRNRYAVALYDSYNPEILFGEVLLTPEWTTPNPTKEELRLNGGIPPKPQPVLPSEFIIQLYNPDQQIHVQWNAGSWTSAPYWGFDIPQQSFRQPSVSSLDRIQDDPSLSEATPKLCFKWKKEGKLSKDYVCSLSDKSNNTDGHKRKNREPDITMGIFKNFKEITVYEPNLSRVDVEDPKGFEVVMILGAVVIREVFNCNLKEAFNISDIVSSPTAGPLTPQSPTRREGFPFADAAQAVHGSRHSSTSSKMPPTDPRTQWELDVEAAQLRKQVEAEEREQRRADAAETERVRKMVKEEQRRARERQKEIDRETERLKKIYGKEEKASLQQLGNNRPPPALPDRNSYHPPSPPAQTPSSTAYPPAPVSRPLSAASTPYIASNLQPQAYGHGQYLTPSAGPSSDDVSSTPAGQPAPKKSFWRLRGNSDAGSKLTKPRSTVT